MTSSANACDNAPTAAVLPHRLIPGVGVFYLVPHNGKPTSEKLDAVIRFTVSNNPYLFNLKHTTMFKLLTKQQIAALTADELKAYKEALTAFIKEWRTKYPDGKRVTARVRALSPTAAPNPDTTKEWRYAIDVVSDDADFATAVPNGRLLRPVSNADIIAKSAGFMSFGHMALTLLPIADKGKLTFTMNLRVEGEEYGTGMKRGKYTTTSFAQENFEYEPSPAVAARVQKATEKAIERGYENMLAFQPQHTAPVATETAVSDDTEI